MSSILAFFESDIKNAPQPKFNQYPEPFRESPPWLLVGSFEFFFTGFSLQLFSLQPVHAVTFAKMEGVEYLFQRQKITLDI